MKKLSLQQIGEQRLSVEESLGGQRLPVYVLLDNIRSLYNVGSIFRTADAVRLEKILICGITGRPPRKEIDKTALGAVEAVPWEYWESAREAINHLKAQQIPIIALEHTDTSLPHWEMPYTFPCCLVVGNEVWGIQEDLLPLADAAVEIPMFGTKHSLNVSVAFGVTIYQMASAFLNSGGNYQI